MKVITATMAKTIATQMADQPELSKMMNTLLLKALKGERQAIFHRPAHIPVFRSAHPMDALPNRWTHDAL